MSDNLNSTGFLLKNLMENMTDNIYFKDTQSRFIMVNKAFCDWTGLSPDHVIGQTDFDLFASAHAQQAFDDEQRIVASGKPMIGIEEKETWPDGRVTWVSTTKMPLKSSDGETIGTFGVSRDITDHKEAELQAARYAEQIRCIKERMEEDVRMAAELQKTFFPRTYPVFPEGAPPEESVVHFLHYYHPSGMVSGDFCTIRRLSATESGIFLCDVMGHGVRAALGTALICAMVEEVSSQEKDPGGFLGRMNELLLPILRQEDTFLYATACYMVFDAATGQLRLANAGHPVPLHFQAAEKTADWLFGDDTLRGPALAIAEGAVFETAEKTLLPGDAVVLYTDGLYEAENDAGEEFGEARLLAAAQRLAGERLEDVFPTLADETARFAALNDDICLVGLRYKRPMA
ncbi:SpoIIE family protein phosphatase [Pontiella sulfatireligans]|uniref:Phosphoserine phosphatase RsbU n=1 Tax=Pontiella sulfatireligans TaxID=2750658 RepID=A0A6C2UPC6_9BACT|nr:SpoIIE family protein phosphatase [Pontiella sulfatireligans]VGO21167.1 Phosphoserine phosphatase RsbU [Pontiella sulfatireligans]